MKSHATGSVLAISLVLLTAITLIAIMGMQRAGLQTKIVANIQHKEIAFNTALGDIDKVYQDIQEGNTQTLSDAMNSPLNIATASSGVNRNPLFEVTTIIRHLDPQMEAGKAVTSSLRNDNSRGKNGAGIEMFEIATSATLPNGSSSSQLVGTTILSPE
jgi:Tfp pilus assembly protein PilX